MEELFSSKKLDFAFHLSQCSDSYFLEFSIRALPAASLSLIVWTVLEGLVILAWMLSHQVWRKKNEYCFKTLMVNDVFLQQ